MIDEYHMIGPFSGGAWVSSQLLSWANYERHEALEICGGWVCSGVCFSLTRHELGIMGYYGCFFLGGRNMLMKIILLFPGRRHG